MVTPGDIRYTKVLMLGPLLIAMVNVVYKLGSIVYILKTLHIYERAAATSFDATVTGNLIKCYMCPHSAHHYRRHRPNKLFTLRSDAMRTSRAIHIFLQRLHSSMCV